MRTLAIPRKLTHITPDWLTDALRSSGALQQARVTAITREPLGEVEGFIGQLERIHLEYDSAEPGAPASLIAKLPTLVRTNRVAGEMLAAYEREIFFYRELAGRLPCRVPRIYYADMDLSPLSKHAPKILVWMDRRSALLIAVLMLVAVVFTLLSRRRYAILMEDMAPAKVGDQVAGADPEVCRAALEVLGEIQAQFWESSELDAHFWLQRQDLAVKAMGLMYVQTRDAFAKRFLERHPELGPCLNWLDEHADDLTRVFHGSSPHTLLHMDYRLDNLFFDEAGIIVFDFQVVARGPGVYDAAYFLSCGLRSEFGEEVESALIVAYHQALIAGGVTDYSLEQCRLDYQRALLLNLARMTGIDSMDMGEGRGAELIDLWIERLATRLASVDLSKLLPMQPPPSG